MRARHPLIVVWAFAFAALFASSGQPGNAQAASGQAATGKFFYETYYYCLPATEARIDEIIQRAEAPIYDAEVERGELSDWGWYAHRVGGRWRRLFMEVGPSQESLFAAQDRAGAAFASDFVNERDEFRNGCTSHEDYIWEATDGAHSPLPDGGALIAAYLRCEPGRKPDSVFADRSKKGPGRVNG